MIIGVHGIAEEQLGRAQLLRAWKPALSDGLELVLGCEPRLLPFDMAFFGNKFLKPPSDGKAGTGAAGRLDELGDDEIADLMQAALEVVTQEDVSAAEAMPPSKMFGRVPRPLQAVLRALDMRFGAAAGVLYLGSLRQVRQYLCDAELKSAVDAIVAKSVREDTRVLIGHSLGSVVAWEYVRQHSDHALSLFLTLGSPLGLRMVRSRLPRFGLPGSVPEQVEAWVNLRDPRDPVACGGDVDGIWPGVADRRVNNGKEAHRATAYLSKFEAGAAILSALPGLGGA